MRALRVSSQTSEQLEALRQLYRHTRDVRIRTRTQIVLLAVEQAMTAPKIAEIVRENDGTVLGSGVMKRREPRDSQTALV